MSTSYDLNDYQFDLPPECIAQHPAPQRDQSRLMALVGHEQQHLAFGDIGRFLVPGDVLVLNRTKVMKARCFAYKDTGTRIEVFVLAIQVDPGRVPVMLRPAKRVKPGSVLHFPKADVRVSLVEKSDQGRGLLAFSSFDELCSVLASDGELPLPPYIKREQGPAGEDEERYQTVFARDLGAVAAPTAGLHFTAALLDNLAQAGVQLAYVTHHVGIGTFKPLLAEDVRDHQMESETYTIDEETAALLNGAKREGRRILAVGTTSTRCLESNFTEGFSAGTRETFHYIYPGYRFKAISGLITNFHLPGSSLLLLVSALMGRERMLGAYREALALNYRFYSYGDAMLLIPPTEP